jgi:hypothetical protein
MNKIRKGNRVFRIVSSVNIYYFLAQMQGLKLSYQWMGYKLLMDISKVQKGVKKWS